MKMFSSLFNNLFVFSHKARMDLNMGLLWV